MSRTTLNPGDLVIWGPETALSHYYMVGPHPTEFLDGVAGLYPLLGDPVPWHKNGGPTVEEAQAILEAGPQGPNLLARYGLTGYLYKAYDDATGESYPDPHLEVD